MTGRFENVYLNGMGAFLPGLPVPNAEIDRYIEPLNRQSGRIKQRVLRENGIETRHYAIDPDGVTRHSASDMAARAIRSCLKKADVPIGEVSLLCAGTSGGDTLIPALANMIQGELGAPPMETSSHQGVCLAGVVALNYACLSIDSGRHRTALVAASEVPSRMFKRSRFAPRDYDADFDSHFLRWMLSDGAAAAVLADRPAASGLSLRVHKLHLKSFSGDFPTCMQMGFPHDAGPRSLFDFPSFGDAEREGAMSLRQDIRLLPHLFDVAIHEYMRLAQQGWLEGREVDHFLCHYSSEKFAPIVEALMGSAGLGIPKERWYSNLKTRGNTGSASIFIMLEEFLRTRRVRPGETILCFIPESGRFSVGFLLLEVAGARSAPVPALASARDGAETKGLPELMRDLGVVWHDFRSRMMRTPFIQSIIQGRVTREDYLRWMSCWIPQVREGSGWMRLAAENMRDPYLGLRDIIEAHAREEQSDFKMLFEDYRRAGGSEPAIEGLRRNAGGEALHAFMLARAGRPNAVGLLGAMHIIEGTGARIIPTILPWLKKRLGLGEDCFRFLRYHGENDSRHLERWLEAVGLVLRASPDGSAAAEIVKTAKTTADLYLSQMEAV